MNRSTFFAHDTISTFVLKVAKPLAVSLILMSGSTSLATTYTFEGITAGPFSFTGPYGNDLRQEFSVYEGSRVRFILKFDQTDYVGNAFTNDVKIFINDQMVDLVGDRVSQFGYIYDDGSIGGVNSSLRLRNNGSFITTRQKPRRRRTALWPPAGLALILD